MIWYWKIPPPVRRARSFDRLCGRPLGAADYLRLAHAFQTLILENVPQMTRDMRNEAKRFVTLIDALYETRTKLIMSAAVEPGKLYVDGDGSFEFERTASRLMEMRSEAYLGRPAAPWGKARVEFGRKYQIYRLRDSQRNRPPYL